MPSPVHHIDTGSALRLLPVRDPETNRHQPLFMRAATDFEFGAALTVVIAGGKAEVAARGHLSRSSRRPSFAFHGPSLNPQRPVSKLPDGAAPRKLRC